MEIVLPDCLTRTTAGEILVAGHRIGLFQLVEHYNEGESAEMLASRYPTLSLALVHRIIAFYLDNQAEVDAYVVDCSGIMTQQRKSAQTVDVNTLRQRLSESDVTKGTTETQVH
jgi:uncharacterized protein (DUF433 family)